MMNSRVPSVGHHERPSWGISTFVAVVTLSSALCSVSAFQQRWSPPTTALSPSTVTRGRVTRQPWFFVRTPTSSSTSTRVMSGGDTDEIYPSFGSREEYLTYLADASALPRGFRAGVANGKFRPVEAPSLGELDIRATVLYLTEGATTSWAATFTRNKFPGAPVTVGKRLLAEGAPLRAVVINNKVSNVCSGSDSGGIDEALQVCDAVAEALGFSPNEKVFPSSTGVIGWRLPANELASEIVPKAVEDLWSSSEHALKAAEAICTTDRYPKLRSTTLSNGARIVGIAKGAGMIEPNMATMLCYILTDAVVEPSSSLQSMLNDAVDASFNSISVDGDESTSDTVLLISSGAWGAAGASPSVCDADEFATSLHALCRGLASDLVRNGEGTSHVVRVTVRNFPGTDEGARTVGRHLVNSPLTKCAVAGNDPNTGRLAAAVGSFLGKYCRDVDVDTSAITLTLGGRTIFAGGRFVLEGDDVERELSDHMVDAAFGPTDTYPKHQRFVEVGLDFGTSNGGNAGGGGGTAVVLGSDLTDEYVAINADYRT